MLAYEYAECHNGFGLLRRRAHLTVFERAVYDIGILGGAFSALPLSTVSTLSRAKPMIDWLSLYSLYALPRISTRRQKT